MNGIVIGGKILARQIETELALRVQRVQDKSNGRSPILATILVGEALASATYVRMKGNACKRVGNEPAYGSATSAGIMRLLRSYDVALEGKHAVVVGRSPILGKSIAMMLLNANATVTVCHLKTQGLSEIVSRADIIVGTVGKPEFIKGAWIKEGAVVVDAGYHPGNVGDIELSAVMDKCAAYTTVPGGVGPMTIATLIAQTVEAAEKNI